MHIQKRKFFYLSGFDPRGWRYYREILTKAISEYNNITNVKIKATKKSKHQIELRHLDQNTINDYQFLPWDDIVRNYWVRNPLSLLWQSLYAYILYVRNMRWSLIHTLAPGPIITGFYPLISCFLIFTFLYIFLSFCLHLIGIENNPNILLSLLISFIGAAFILDKIKSLWLLRFFIFNAHAFRSQSNILKEHINHFKKEITNALADPEYDEVILCAHSNGSILTIPLLYSLRDQFTPENLKKLKILTLGHCIPLTSYYCDAKDFSHALKALKEYPLIWCDLSSPADSVSFALHDPFQPDPENKKTHLYMRSPQFHKYYSKENYKKLRKNKFDIHFAYLNNADTQSPFNFLAMMTSDQPLENIFR